ncbi:MAG: NAD(P)/FAD-dependent oxidoreductase [Erysipelotrichaceae bacterium]|nr:NAD(P)/FAD-dependent oxidoreductase [Erysipelotrichaceae bacterium]
MKLEKLQKELLKIDSNIKAFEKDDCIFLSGEVDDYSKVVKAGELAVDKKRYLGLVNNIKVKGFTQKVVLPKINDLKYDKQTCDVLIIGGGVTGCATARELAKYNLKVMLVEKGPDVASGQSSRNGGVVHVGLNFSTNSLKLKYCVQGNNMYEQLSKDLHVPFEHKGQVTFARTKLEMLALYIFKMGGKKKGIDKLELMNREDLLKIEPSVPEWAVGGLWMGTGGITCPHKMTIALAENAAENGAEICLNTAVLSMKLENDLIKEVVTNRGTIYPKVVVNASGVYADDIAEMANDRTFTIHPRIGTDMITDKKVGYMVNTSMGKTPFTLSPSQLKTIPNNPIAKIKAMIKNSKSHSKGVGLIHSVDGNMLVGPNADETMDKEDTSTNRKVFNNIIKVQQEVAPNFKASDVIAYFTGVRAPTYEEDFVVRQGIKTKNIFEAAGIQSPGLTAAPAIGKDLATWIHDYLISIGFDVEENKNYNPKRQYKPVLSELSYEERDKLIKQNPDYGQIICRCEEISKGEIIDALRSPLPVYTVDGIKRRVRPGMGRCQGGFCMPLVMKIISEETNLPLEEVYKSTSESKIIYGNTK